MAQYLLKLKDGSERGPLTAGEINKLLETGELTLEDLVLDKEQKAFIPISESGIPGIRRKKKRHKEFRIRNKGEEEEREVEKTLLVQTPENLETETTKVHKKYNQYPAKKEKKKEKTKTVQVEVRKEKKEPKKEITTLDPNAKTGVHDFKVVLREIKNQVQIGRDTKDSFEDFQKKTTPLLPEKEKRKRMILLVPMAFLLIFFDVLFDDKNQMEVEGRKADNPISVPFENEFLEEKKSDDLLIRGITSLKEKTYQGKLDAAQSFRKSVSFNSQNKTAMGYLLLTYVDLLKYSKNKYQDGNTVFKIFETARKFEYKELRIVLAKSKFFVIFEKYNAAVKLIEDFLRINKNPSLKLMAVYLEALFQTKQYDKSEKLIEKMRKFKKWPSELYISLINLFLQQGDLKQALAYAKEGKRKNSTKEIVLYLAKLYSMTGKIEKSKSILKKIADSDVGRFNSIEKSLFYETYGNILALSGKINEAAKNYKISLQAFRNPHLQSKLASLEETLDSDVANQVINQSKSKEYILRSKRAMNEKKWTLAISSAIEAVDIFPQSIEARLNLIDVQVERAYYTEAIKNIEKTLKIFPGEHKLKFIYVLTLIQSLKLDYAKKQIDILSGSSFRSTYWYPYLLAKLFEKLKLASLAAKWYQTTLNQNPLFDQAYFDFASLLVRMRKYKSARNVISKAKSIDPSNTNYKILFSKVLRVQHVDFALGYLRKELEKDPENGQILGEIAINYYKSGQTNQFKRVFEKLKNMQAREVEVFKYMIKISLLEEKFEDAIRYSFDLLNLDPGNLKIRMDLAVLFFELGNTPRAETQFNLIRERVSDYPHINTYQARISLRKGNTDEAVKYIKEELKKNPRIEEAHILLGNIYANQEKYTEALSKYREAQRVNPRSVDALIGIAGIKYRQNHVEQALDLYKKASGINKNNPFIHKQLGHAYRSLGQSSLAIESYQVFLKLSPDSADREKIENIVNSLR